MRQQRQGDVMEIGTIINLLRSLPETAALKPGDRLNVKVLEVLEHQRVRVSLGGFRTLAAVAFPVAAGDEFRVQVQISVGGQLRLQMIPPDAVPAMSTGRAEVPVTSVAAEALKEVQVRIDQMVDAMAQQSGSPRRSVVPGKVVDALRLFIEPFDPGTTSAALARKLKEFCEDSGLFLEQRLAAVIGKAVGRTGAAAAAETGAEGAAGRILATDLKARLSVIKDFFDSEAGRLLVQDRSEAAGIARAASELLAGVRAGQAQMAQSAAAADSFRIVHFALPMPDARCRAGLKIAYRQRPGAGKREGHRAAILLELDRMGAVRTDLALLDSRLTVSIFVSSSDLRDFINRHASEVRATLAPFFEHVAVQVSVSSRKIEQFVSEDWRPALETQVDVRV